MADKVITVKLQRGDATSWGFRLAGGKDFGYPLSLQRVNPGSLAEQAGLQTGDALIRIQGKSTDDLRHKEAQDAIVRAGNYLELSVQRGVSMTWKPQVTPVGSLPKPAPLSNGEPAPLTKTSLAATKQPYKPVGTGHNTAAKPFGANVPALVHNPYNSPAPLYSMNNIADALAAQTEVLTTGAVGINFMKGDKPLNKESAVLRMVQEQDKRPQGESLGCPAVDQTQSHAFRRLQAALYDDTPPPSGTDPSLQSPGVKNVHDPLTVNTTPEPTRMVNLRHVEAPKTSDAPPNTSVGAPNTCAECGRLIVGVFVRIRDRPLHAECFRCATCGTSLKNVGYYNVNEKLYCDVHAKGAARAHHQEAEPMAVSPGGQVSRPALKPFSSQTPLSQPSSYSPVPKPMTPQFSPGQYSPAPQFSPAPPAPQPATSLYGAPPPAPQPSEADESGVVTDSLVAMGPTMKYPLGPTTAKPTTPQSSPWSRTHPHTAPSADVHSPAPGCSKFTWPPPQPGGPSPTTAGAPPPFESAYRPPPQQAPQTKTPSHVPSASPFLLGASPSSRPFAAPHSEPPHQQKSAPMTPGGSWTPSLTGATCGITGTRPAPRRGRGQLTQPVGAGLKIPICASCGSPIRGPFLQAMGKTWCPEHFLCSNRTCHRSLQDIGFVEEHGKLYCETCYENYLAPICKKCQHRIKGDCLNALEQTWHPECFVCAYCKTPFGNSSFYMEDGQPYCEKDWNELFTSKCVGCGYPIEAGDRWVEALSNNYHSKCFKCTICHNNLEGKSFYAKGGRPICKAHAR